MSRLSDSIFLTVVFIVAAVAMDLSIFMLLITAGIFAGLAFVALFIVLGLYRAAMWVSDRRERN